MSFQRLLYFLFFFLLFIQAQAQDKYSNFKAFNSIPNQVETYLYKNLENAKSVKERLAYLDTIAQIFDKTDLADSLLFYGERLQKTIAELPATHPAYKNFYYYGIYYEAVAKRKMGLLDEAIATYIQGLERLNGTKDKLYANYLKLGLAEIYLQKEELQKAEDIINQLLQHKETNENLDALVLTTLGDLQYRNNEWELAKATYTKVLQLPVTKNLDKLSCRIKLNLTKLQSPNISASQALNKFQQIKNDCLSKGYYGYYIQAVLNEGYIYLKEKNYKAAEIALSTAYINTVSWNRLELQKKVNRALVDLYVTKEDYKNAFNLMTQYEAVNQTIASQQNERQVRELEEKYKSLEKEREIIKLQEAKLKDQIEIDKQRTIKNAVLIGFLIILVPIILLLIVYYQKLQAQSEINRQQEDLNRKEMESLQQEQELKLARTSLKIQTKERKRIARELHDSIGGNLAAIKLQMNKLDLTTVTAVSVKKQLDSTYSQVREISHSLLPEEFKEQSFVPIVQNYMEQFNDPEKQTYYFNAYPEEAINKLPKKLQVVLFNMIKELTTNAVKHAKANQVMIQLNDSPEDKSLFLMYEDDGIGFAPNNSEGIGLKNLKSRIEELQGNLSIDSSPGKGTVISIHIPKHQEIASNENSL
ncbi:tetratricopeptide repeat-containing sensor histidine kinase [Zunongwangia pacifica]|uniref:Oxygen sensor histidine kinase NreB n=1 Tax=Zunongwangia pacifica TaxID=2911062 RepID=A0A9X1ZSL0_9FLAO|nr:sensor histidine kinase [Zunongwangia pacifica]MCL6220267.1 histidine kinase [Zunongwangia pacifica]